MSGDYLSRHEPAAHSPEKHVLHVQRGFRMQGGKGGIMDVLGDWATGWRELWATGWREFGATRVFEF